MVTQFVFALSILVIASLFVRWDKAMHTLDLGFRDAERILLMQTELSVADHQDIDAWKRSIEGAESQLDPAMMAVQYRTLSRP